MGMDIKIDNVNSYIEGMTKSLMDKTFFLEKINADSFLDFGCADGALLKFLQELFPKYHYMGYDISAEMLRRANKDSKDIVFSDNLELFKMIKTEKSALILSSIIHEIYSYSDSKEFWKQVYDKINAKYIVIRDMMVDSKQLKDSNPEFVRRVRMEADQILLSDFERVWGTIDSNKNLIHFLLKYRYKENWSRELMENYLPITKEQLIARIPKNYRIVYMEHFTPGYLKGFIEDDYSFELTEKTHLKMIIERID